ncbi:2900_t:CDS:2 [Racocetra fulgida]|uniref:2900_t:CDS:1 n=1 Tax=Racocetra fulgida TaxID=60492 RepID=A0A9N8ZDX5_9GLOM|nr:2900_t:CDS:2 [Racocetra fulgida]
MAFFKEENNELYHYTVQTVRRARKELKKKFVMVFINLINYYEDIYRNDDKYE